MKVLILSCNTGGGHNAAGRAIQQQLQAAGVPCDVVDTLAFASRLRENMVCKGHVLAYRYLPKLYGQLYDYVENRPAKKDKKSSVYDNSIGYADKIYRFIVQNGYDTVICVHVFAATAITAILHQHPGAVRSYFVATDYTCSPGVADAEMDAYIIPHPALTQEFATAGVPRERLLPLGIPVAESFTTRQDKAATAAQLGLPPHERLVLMMCGSMGCGPLAQLAEGCLAELPAGSLLVAICGDNRRLYEELAAIHSPQLLVLGYTKLIDQYMDAADLLLTKPGGLSSSEAIAKRLPMLLVDAVPGVESRNLDFLVGEGCALSAPDTGDLVALAADCLADPQMTRQMLDAQARFPQNSARQLAQAILQLANHPPRSSPVAKYVDVLQGGRP